MLVGDRGPRRWESWTVGRSDWWWVCTDEGRLRCATLSLLSWLSVLVGFGRGPECLKNFTRGSATAATDPYIRAAAVDTSHRRADPTYLPMYRAVSPDATGRHHLIQRPARGSEACAADAMIKSRPRARKVVAAINSKTHDVESAHAPAGHDRSGHGRRI